ncbi:hypothetical protein AVEN_181479-1 [Araneus ventricosus]|uniref:Uncharacterized protein n=1 Tax=Araneus ventricosus TaxID=182803 RepID=A0A4Y2F3Q5_ARAVE|nr:hypothetical protein AVEN_181479-1 [Araneus ventricosus]
MIRNCRPYTSGVLCRGCTTLEPALPQPNNSEREQAKKNKVRVVGWEHLTVDRAPKDCSDCSSSHRQTQWEESWDSPSEAQPSSCCAVSEF